MRNYLHGKMTMIIMYNDWANTIGKKCQEYGVDYMMNIPLQN